MSLLLEPFVLSRGSNSDESLLVTNTKTLTTRDKIKCACFVRILINAAVFLSTLKPREKILLIISSRQPTDKIQITFFERCSFFFFFLTVFTEKELLKRNNFGKNIY